MIAGVEAALERATAKAQRRKSCADVVSSDEGSSGSKPGMMKTLEMAGPEGRPEKDGPHPSHCIPAIMAMARNHLPDRALLRQEEATAQIATNLQPSQIAKG